MRDSPRLGAYLYVMLLAQAAGVTTVTSEHIGEMAGVNPTMVRRDLLRFGRVGKRGAGYRPEVLIPLLRGVPTRGCAVLLIAAQQRRKPIHDSGVGQLVTRAAGLAEMIELWLAEAAS